uniref:C2H2-type domain-containing protein n=1 Tax=Haemonchus contortus TaxID=6289 RepID=A0A7I4Z4D6_HAECO
MSMSKPDPEETDPKQELTWTCFFCGQTLPLCITVLEHAEFQCFDRDNKTIQTPMAVPYIRTPTIAPLSMRTVEDFRPKIDTTWKCIFCNEKFPRKTKVEDHVVACLLGPYEECEQCYGHLSLYSKVEHVKSRHFLPKDNKIKTHTIISLRHY